MVPRRGPFFTRTTKRRLGSSTVTSLGVCIVSPGPGVRRTLPQRKTPAQPGARPPPVSHSNGSVFGLGPDGETGTLSARRPRLRHRGPPRGRGNRGKCFVFNGLARPLLLSTLTGEETPMTAALSFDEA